MARQPASVRAALTAGLQRRLELISRIVPGKTKAVRREKAIVVFSTMIGAMLLARSVQNAEFSDEILKVAAEAVPKVAQETTRA
jgi:TetR/AcrR family transcriptional repressor of nem operon